MQTKLERQQIVKGILFALGAAFFYGAATVISKKVVSYDIPPLVASAFTLFFGAVTLVLISAGSPQGRDIRFEGHRKAVLFLILSGICSGTAVTLLFFALSLAPVVVVSPLISLNPMIAIILSAIFLKHLEKVTPRVVLGGALVAVGVIVIAVAPK